MMGEHAKSEGLFYYFKLADHVPQTHVLRLIDRHVDFGFLRNRLRPLYSETGRPSVDPDPPGGTHFSTVYCYGIDGIRICQSFTPPHD